MKKLKKTFLDLWRSRSVQILLVPWAAIFLFLHLANTQDGGPNATSRFLTMRSMDEEGSFRIDTRIGASTDWAKTPDGHFFSNKAPGPMLLGFPAFFVVDQIPRIWEKGKRDEHGERPYPGYFQKTLTSYLNQIIPLLLLMALILQWLDETGARRSTQLYFVLATLFGSTASLYFNNYSGHGFTAVLELGVLYSLLKKRYAWVGFFAGSALLSDYGFGMQIPALVVALAYALFARKEFWRPVQRLALGAFVPAGLWIWYHTSCFGSPFLIANNFQNPVFLDTINEKDNLWGIFHIPRISVLWELLFGQSRGLLFTQPWILLLLPLGVLPFLGAKKAKEKKVSEPLLLRRVSALFCVLSLAGLLVMNMSYGGWAGGGASGPRYLSGIFLCFALWIALELDGLPGWLRKGFWGLLGMSLIFRGLVYTSTILGPSLPLWQWYLSEFPLHAKTASLRFAVFTLFFYLAFRWQKKREKRRAA